MFKEVGDFFDSFNVIYFVGDLCECFIIVNFFLVMVDVFECVDILVNVSC